MGRRNNVICDEKVVLNCRKVGGKSVSADGLGNPGGWVADGDRLGWRQRSYAVLDDGQAGVLGYAGAGDAGVLWVLSRLRVNEKGDSALQMLGCRG